MQAKTIAFTILGILALLCLSALPTFAQGTPIPFVRPQWFNSNGIPCSGCKLYSYIAGTSTPQATYFDAALSMPNTNPIVLDAAGRATVFLGSLSYKFVLNLPNGSQLWSIDGVNASALALLSLNNIWTGSNDFTGATIFDGPTTFNVGFTSNGPANLLNGGTLQGTFTGSPIFSGTPTFPNGFSSTVATGNPPFTVASTTQVPNLNVSQLEGCTWEVPCPLGSVTPNTVASTTLNASTSFTLAGSTPQTSVQGTDTALLSSHITSPSTGQGLCLDAQGGATNAGCSTPAISAFCTPLIMSGDVTGSSSLVPVGTVNCTMPAAGCPCRAMINWNVAVSMTTNHDVEFWVNDGALNFRHAHVNGQTADTTGASQGLVTPTTYANGASVTFTLQTQGASSANYTVVAAAAVGPGANSGMDVSILTSN